jgi:hypothetical protein
MQGAAKKQNDSDEDLFALHAHVAQLVEHTLGKGEVIGSIPIVSSEAITAPPY